MILLKGNVPPRSLLLLLLMERIMLAITALRFHHVLAEVEGTFSVVQLRRIGHPGAGAGDHGADGVEAVDVANLRPDVRLADGRRRRGQVVAVDAVTLFLGDPVVLVVDGSLGSLSLSFFVLKAALDAVGGMVAHLSTISLTTTSSLTGRSGSRS